MGLRQAVKVLLRCLEPIILKNNLSLHNPDWVHGPLKGLSGPNNSDLETTQASQELCLVGSPMDSDMVTIPS